MNLSSLAVHRRALTVAGTFYTRNLNPADRAPLMALHQAVVRSSVEGQLNALMASVGEDEYEMAHERVRFSQNDVAFVGPKTIAQGYVAIEPGQLVRARPVLDPQASGVQVGSYLYDKQAGDPLPDGLRHGGFWMVPWEGPAPDVLFSGSRALVNQQEFWVLDGALAFRKSPRALFPNSCIIVERVRRKAANLLSQVWGPAGAAGARWQHTGERSDFARALLVAAGLTPGPVRVVDKFETRQGWLAVLEDGRVIPATTPTLGDVAATQCVEGVAEVVFPSSGAWWQPLGMMDPIRPLRSVAAEFGHATLKFTASAPSWPAPAAKLRADFGAATEAFWSWADALQVSTGRYWSTLAGMTAGNTYYRPGFEFWLRNLGHGSKLCVVVDRGLGDERREKIKRAAKLHSHHGMTVNFSTDV